MLDSLLLVLRGQIAERRGCCGRGRSSLLHSVMHIQLSVAVRQLAGGGSELSHSTHCARTCTPTGVRDSGRTDGRTQSGQCFLRKKFTCRTFTKSKTGSDASSWRKNSNHSLQPYIYWYVCMSLLSSSHYNFAAYTTHHLL